MYLTLACSLVLQACASACDRGGSGPDDPVHPVGGGGGTAGHGGGGSGGIGAGGVGGVGGDGGHAGAGGALGWLIGNAGWTAVAGSEKVSSLCTVEEIDQPRLRYPRLSFDRPCGGGCNRADVVQGFGTFTSGWALSTTRLTDGSVAPLLSTSHRPAEEILWSVRRLIRLSDGDSIGAFRYHRTAGQVGGCSKLVAGESPLLSGLAGGDAETGGVGIAIRSPDDRSWRWPVLWSAFGSLDDYCRAFDIESLPALVQHCGTVYIEDRGAGTPRVDLNQSNVRTGAGERELGVWTIAAEGPTSRLMGWTRGSGVVQLSDAIPGDSCGVALSATRIAGLSGRTGSGINGCGGTWEEPRFYWMDRRAGPTAGPVSSSGVLWPEPVDISKVVTWGDFIAAELGRPDPPGEFNVGPMLLVYRISDGQLRRLEPRAEHRFGSDGITLTDEHLYVVETPRDVNDEFLRELTRYDLSAFEQLGTRL